MSALALAASRKARLNAMAEAGDKGADAALSLMENPNHFLSTVQVGITSIGTFNGIVGEAAFSAGLSAALAARENAVSPALLGVIQHLIGLIDQCFSVAGAGEVRHAG